MLGVGSSYPGVLVHANMDLLLRWRLNKHLIPLTSRVTAKHSYTINDKVCITRKQVIALSLFDEQPSQEFQSVQKMSEDSTTEVTLKSATTCS